MSQATIETSRGFDIVLKVAERCNLACPYCYYFFMEYGGAKKSIPIMTEETVNELPKFLSRSVERLNLLRLNVVLHGGEPLLMKKARVDDLCTKLRTALDPIVELRLATQTNGVLIDEEWIDLFEKHRITVGVSIDGNRERHDAGRPDHSGRGSYDRAVAGLRLLQKAVREGKLDRSGTLSVVSTESEDLLHHLVHELNSNSPNLNFPRGGWDHEEAIAWNDHIASHRRIVRYWLDNLIYPDFHYVRGLTDVLFALKNEKGASRNDARASSRHYIATISSEGKLLVDDNMLGVDDLFSESDLDIFGTSLLDLIESPAWQMMNEAVDQQPAECEGCLWYRSCRGGELFNRFSKKEGFSKRSILCETIQMIHEETASYLVKNGLTTLEELSDRLSATPVVTGKSTLDGLINADHKGACYVV